MLRKPYIKKLGRVEGLNVYLVNGRYVRDKLDIDYTMGGHDLRYGFIPFAEVWIDDDLSRDERPFVIAHEVKERRLMTKGMSYELAHQGANMVEGKMRRGS